jgi:hypothetical protein
MRTGIVAIIVVAACGKGGEDKQKAAERTMAARATEAEVHLRSLQKELAMYREEKAGYPQGSAPLTPPKPCCQSPDQQCPAGGFEHEIWKTLGFAIDVPHRFQFAYEGTTDAATITAVADLDCDGTTVTYVLDAQADRIEVVRPAMPD